ncbi:hypothetical protein TruAng_004424 [Truncatella angustata]|nr:hypothetical protein TruAng_004424 [Truncatella angustata]
MGLKAWFQRFVSKVKELLGVHDQYNDFRAIAFFTDGSQMVYTGKPWGSAFEQFKNHAGEYAYAVQLNMTGSFWKFE